MATKISKGLAQKIKRLKNKVDKLVQKKAKLTAIEGAPPALMQLMGSKYALNSLKSKLKVLDIIQGYSPDLLDTLSDILYMEKERQALEKKLWAEIKKANTFKTTSKSIGYRGGALTLGASISQA
jgi:hypothetical protein